MEDNLQIPLLSILIPAYNAGSRIEDCLNSITSQIIDESEIEIIVIDDGSTDNTLQIIKDAQSSHKCISYRSRENRGISATRNELLKLKRGQYMWFVDADDFISPQSLAIIREMLITDVLDCLMLSFNTIAISGNAITHKYSGNYNSGIELTNNNIYDNSLWSRIYRSKIIDDNEICFGNYSMGEDFDFVYRLIPHLGKCSCVDMVVYNYRLMQHSATQEKNLEHRRKSAADSLTIILSYKDYFSRFKADDTKVLKLPLNLFIIGHLYAIANEPLSWREKLSELKQLKKAKILPLKPVIKGNARRRIFTMIINNYFLRIMYFLAMHIKCKHHTS